MGRELGRRSAGRVVRAGGGGTTDATGSAETSGVAVGATTVALDGGVAVGAGSAGAEDAAGAGTDSEAALSIGAL